MSKSTTYTEDIFSIPTAPYREAWVLNRIKILLEKQNTPYVTDSWGNVIAGVSKLSELKNSKRVALVAHTDHPGFHLVRALNKSGKWMARWFGGAPPKMKGAKLAIYHPHFPGLKAQGVCLSPSINKKKQGAFQIQFRKHQPFELSAKCFGAFDYPGYKKSGSKIITRVADDLAGVVIILSTLAKLQKQDKKNFLGIFTRAEEVGFMGALGFIFDEYMGPKNRVISLEASSQRPQARVGKGPIVRLGDRKTLFDSEMISQLDAAAKDIKHQRRIMDGGSCEATAFNAFGIRAAGIAVPLGNYHNQRPNGKPGPEFIDVNDLQGAVDICIEFYKNLSKTNTPGDALRDDLKKRFKQQTHLLKGDLQFEY